MRATFIIEASNSEGAIYRVQATVDFQILSWLVRSIGL